MSRKNTLPPSACRFRSRRLRIESLEERRLLAVAAVTNNLDVVNGDTSSIEALVNTDGGDGVSLREAIEATNNSAGADEITFAFGHDGPETILLTAGELRIFQALTIHGGSFGRITIDAQEQSRVMRIDNFDTSIDSFAVTLQGLTLTGGHESDPANRGGAILADNLYLFIDDSVIEGNYTTGSTSWGGGIFSEGYVTATNSIFRNNYTTGHRSVGGAIFARGDVTLTDSIVTHNHTKGFGANAGGIRSNGEVILLRSTVSGNWTEGDEAWGGGIDSVHDITVTQSTVSENTTHGNKSYGAGMFTFFGVNITQSTISGNSTRGTNSDGGGIRASRQVTITQSTIANNWTESSGLTGGGLYQTNYSNNFPVTITGSIFSGNTAGDRNSDLQLDPQSAKSVSYSLINDTSGSGVTSFTGVGNVLSYNARLSQLADNGGPTMTHALLPDSRAIDAGNPNPSSPPDFDQRGAPFARVHDGDGADGPRIDMGAHEQQPLPPAMQGDFNVDGSVDAADYTVWRNSFGESVAPYFGADGDGSGVIDADDYKIWRRNFGNVYALPPEAEDASVEVEPPAARGSAAFAVDNSQATTTAIPRVARKFAGVGNLIDQPVSLLLLRRLASAEKNPEKIEAARLPAESASTATTSVLDSLVDAVFKAWQ